MMRLDKYLTEMSVGSRREVKKYIQKGQVKVNQVICKEPERKISPGEDEIMYLNQLIGYSEFEYYMLNKPAGIISATTDKKEQTVVDLIEEKKRTDLFPVGRLDRDTEGLLLITNDGQLSHNLLSPKKHVDKVYYAKIDGVVTEREVASFLHGLDIGEEKPTAPGELTIIKSGVISEIELTIHEGKFHQVKRMFQAVGMEVLYLKRMQMGTLKLDPKLKSGEYRKLTEEERNSLC